jgi:hypothetical protein
MARHKKTRKTRRRRMRGGYLSWNPLNWLKPSPTGPVNTAATGVSNTVTDTTKAVAPMVPSAPAQAAALGTSPGGTVSTGAPILGSTAATPLGTGGRRRRKTRRRH